MKKYRPPAQDFELITAAKMLGISRQALCSLLRQHNVLVASGHGLVPGHAHMSTGNFRVENRTTYITGKIPRHYAVTLVTIQGLAWIDKLIKSEASSAA